MEDVYAMQYQYYTKFYLSDHHTQHQMYQPDIDFSLNNKMENDDFLSINFNIPIKEDQIVININPEIKIETKVIEEETNNIIENINTFLMITYYKRMKRKEQRRKRRVVPMSSSRTDLVTVLRSGLI